MGLNMSRTGKTRSWRLPPALRGYKIEWLRHDVVAGAALFTVLVPRAWPTPRRPAFRR